MKNILLTGGAGYIGSHVANLLLDEGLNVSIIDNLITGNKKLIPSKASFYNCDIDDVNRVQKIIKKNEFDIVMHFAGLIRVDESVKLPKKYNLYNYQKAKKFLNTCFENNLKKIIFSSTAAIYGNPDVSNVQEDTSPNPLNPYSESKLKFENFLLEESKTNDLNYIILRYFNVAGADEKLRSGLISKVSTHLIKVACEVATGKRENLVINGDDYDTYDGTPIRDYIHISDLADIHYVTCKYLIENNDSHIFNCGYGKGYSVKEVIDTFNEILDKKISFKIGPRRVGDSKMIVANTSKFNNFFLWKPKFNNLKYILKTAYEWEKNIK